MRRGGHIVIAVALLVFVVIAVLVAAPAANASPWRRPVDGSVLRAFAVGADRFARGQHRGVDLDAPVGAAVRAACGGRVSFAGRVPGGGLTLSVRCGGLVATYQHLGDAVPRRGQFVTRGAVLGAVGRSGAPRSPRPHLHLGAREAASGRYVDPLRLLGSARTPRALPPLLPRTPSARPRPLGPAPAARLRAVHFSQPAAAPAAPVPRSRVPVTVWAGLTSLVLGLPLGGLITRRRRRRLALAHVARTA